MRTAIIKNSITGATLSQAGTYEFGPPSNRPNGKQCGGAVNDWLGLTGINRMADTPTSKIDAPDYKSVKEGGIPIVGGYGVMNIGPNWHVFAIRYDNGSGIYISDMNRFNTELRRDIYIARGSAEWKLIHGFGGGNPMVDSDGLLEILTVERLNSSNWKKLESAKLKIPEWAKPLSDAQNKLHEANLILSELYSLRINEA